jgi:hypothetical protein
LEFQRLNIFGDPLAEQALILSQKPRFRNFYFRRSGFANHLVEGYLNSGLNPVRYRTGLPGLLTQMIF